MEGKRKFSMRWLIKAAICLAFMFFLTTKSQAQLGIPPIIIVQPLGLSVQNGGTAVFAVVATSLTSMSFDWRLNGKSISPDSNTTIVTGTTNMLLNGILGLVPISTLTIKNVASTNAGNYSVRISNGIGYVTSSTVTLIVLTDTISNVVTNVVNILPTGTGMTASGFKLQLSGPAGSNYVIQASADLKSWAPIATNAAPTGTISYTDTVATNLPLRYYRVKIQ